MLDIENNVYFCSVVGLNISKKSIKKIQTNCKSIIPYGSVNSALPLVKPRRRLTKAEQEQFVLTPDLKSILVGLYLGDLFAFFSKTASLERDAAFICCPFGQK